MHGHGSQNKISILAVTVWSECAVDIFAAMSAYARVFCSTVRLVATVKSNMKYSIGAELRAGSCRGPGALTVKACGATWSSSSQ